jgi:hypothetical protein
MKEAISTWMTELETAAYPASNQESVLSVVS